MIKEVRQFSQNKILIIIMLGLLATWSINSASAYLYEKKPQTKATGAEIKEMIIEKEEEIPYTIERVLDPAIRKGKIVRVQSGQNGLVKKKYLVETTPREIGYTVVKEMQPEILAIGTRDTIIMTASSLKHPQAIMYLEATAYTHTGNPTFTGVYPRVGTIAVDPQVIPLGTKMWVDGYGYGIAQDTGGLIKGHIIDLFMDDEDSCWKWGRRNVKVYILG